MKDEQLNENEISLQDLYKQMLEEINQAKTEVAVRKKQLEDLKPQRQEYEEKCMKLFNVPIKEIDNYINQQESEISTLISDLKSELDKAKLDNTQIP